MPGLPRLIKVCAAAQLATIVLLPLLPRGGDGDGNDDLGDTKYADDGCAEDGAGDPILEGGCARGEARCEDEPATAERGRSLV